MSRTTSLGNDRTINVTISAELERALEGITNSTGVSRASLVRNAIAQYLVNMGALPEPVLYRRELIYTGTFTPVISRKENR